jgi:hypothetical protein
MPDRMTGPRTRIERAPQVLDWYASSRAIRWRASSTNDRHPLGMAARPAATRPGIQMSRSNQADVGCAIPHDHRLYRRPGDMLRPTLHGLFRRRWVNLAIHPAQRGSGEVPGPGSRHREGDPTSLSKGAEIRRTVAATRRGASTETTHLIREARLGHGSCLEEAEPALRWFNGHCKGLTDHRGDVVAHFQRAEHGNAGRICDID